MRQSLKRYDGQGLLSLDVSNAQLHLESSQISCIWRDGTLRPYRSLKMCSWCCESRGGGLVQTDTHMGRVSHWKWLQWQLGMFCSPVNGNSLMHQRGSLGNVALSGAKDQFLYTWTAVTHPPNAQTECINIWQMWPPEKCWCQVAVRPSGAAAAYRESAAVWSTVTLRSLEANTLGFTLAPPRKR